MVVLAFSATFKYEISYLRYMETTIGHVTETGNVSIPKAWRVELGIEPNSEVLIELADEKITIEPLKKKTLKESFKAIDEEIRKKSISFSRKEAIEDDLYG